MAWQREDDPAYLQPYRQASRQHGGGFGSLLWASRHTQSLRFDALRRLSHLHGRIVLDVGAGRADLLDHLLQHRVEPAHYYALEAVDVLADEIERRDLPDCTVIRADFVREPQRMFVGAEAVIFSGSLNTLEPALLYPSLRRAFDAAGEVLLFNFLSNPSLAAASHLHWYRRGDMERFIATLSSQYCFLEDYLDGDCTVRVDKQPTA